MNIKKELTKIIEKSFDVDTLKVIDESFKHKVPKGAQSHFKVIIISNDFIGKSQLERHKKVYLSVHDLMQKIHALSLHTLTREEVQEENLDFKTPDCVR